MRNIIIVLLAILPSFVLASSQAVRISQYPELEKGLKINSMTKCRDRITSACHMHKKMLQLLTCARETMKPNAFCKQNFVLLQDQHALVKSVSALGNIGVIYAKLLATEHREGYFLVDGDGKVIQPSGHLNLKGAKNYAKLKSQYAKLELWPEVVSPPSYRQLANGTQEIIFKQLVLNGCHTCEQVGIATVIYSFDADGKYYATTVQSITPNIDDKTVAL